MDVIDATVHEGMSPEQELIYAIGLAGMKMVWLRSFLYDEENNLTNRQKQCIEGLWSESAKTCLDLSAERRLLAEERGFSHADQAKEEVDAIFDAVKDDLHFRRTASDGILQRILGKGRAKKTSGKDVAGQDTIQQDERDDLAMKFAEWAISVESVPHSY